MPAKSSLTLLKLTAARARANALNARKSTGPASEAGKRASSQNARKHGLSSAAALLPGEDEAAYLARRAAWIAELRPEGAAELDALDAALAAFQGAERCRRAQAAAARQQREALADRRRLDHARRLDRLVGLIATHPREAVELAASFAEGCRWMAGRWTLLEQALADGGYWDAGHLATALNLLGLAPAEAPDDPAGLELLRAAMAMHPACQTRTPDEAAALAFAPFQPAGTSPDEFRDRLEHLTLNLPADEQAAPALEDLARDQHAHWSARADDLEAQDDEQLALEADLLLTDTSPEGALRQRYLAAHLRAYHQALARLDQLQARRRAAESHQPSVSPEPDSSEPAPPEQTEHVPAAIREAPTPGAADNPPARNEPKGRLIEATPASLLTLVPPLQPAHPSPLRPHPPHVHQGPYRP